jgi:hypothetical protein
MLVMHVPRIVGQSRLVLQTTGGGAGLKISWPAEHLFARYHTGCPCTATAMLRSEQFCDQTARMPNLLRRIGGRWVGASQYPRQPVEAVLEFVAAVIVWVRVVGGKSDRVGVVGFPVDSDHDAAVQAVF